VVGVCAVESETQPRFSERDEELARVIGSLAASA
jgi:hypothetical protein